MILILGKPLIFIRKKSLATVVLKKIDLRFEYGAAVTAKDGRIKSFVEKLL